MSAEGFADYLGLDVLDGEQMRVYNVATVLVLEAIDGAAVSSYVAEQWSYDVAADLLKRSETTNGQFEAVDGNRAPNDPLARIRPMLKRYKVTGI